MHKTQRLFISLSISDAAKVALRSAIAYLRSRNEHAHVRWADPDILHCTMLFLGATPLDVEGEIVQILRDETVGYSSFPLQLEPPVSGFPEPRAPKVIIMPLVDPTGLGTHLHKTLRERLIPYSSELARDRKSWTPHVTLGRNPDGTAVRGFLDCRVDELLWDATELTIMRSDLASDGPTYTPLATFSLS